MFLYKVWIQNTTKSTKSHWFYDNTEYQNNILPLIHNYEPAATTTIMTTITTTTNISVTIIHFWSDIIKEVNASITRLIPKLEEPRRDHKQRRCFFSEQESGIDFCYHNFHSHQMASPIRKSNEGNVCKCT